ncbi:MAG: hypothetical protein ABIJ23_03695 [Candidatus Magasanikbacteria bacterium]|nr:hypothetical protein [Patescibacteria group bacterium]MBU1349712.1 hypothetical protein [Patescibacteria group bacterium]MBU2416285.1 hypothetical protein [Patescibacteria group bacterium]
MLDEIVTKLLNKIAKTKQSAFLWAGFLIGFLVFKVLNFGGSYFDSNSYGDHIILKIFEIVITMALIFLIPILILRGRNFKK